MSTTTQNRARILALAIAGALLLAGLPAPTRAAAPAARWGADYFPNVALKTQDGKVVRLWDDLLKDRIVAIDLVYTHCEYQCPLVTARLAQVQRLLGDRMGKDIHFYSITLDPERDTPEVLKAYAEKYHVGPGWLFLTGSKADIQLISTKLGLLSSDATPVNRDGHTAELMVGNVASGQWMRNSALDNPQFLANMIGGFIDGWKRQPARAYAEAGRVSISSGEYLFTTRCSACHSVGRGDGVGPDLLGVTTRRPRAWLARFIAAPDEVLESGDPVAQALFERFNQVQMPNLRLGTEDISSLIDYVEQASRDAAPPPRRALASSHAPEKRP